MPEKQFFFYTINQSSTAITVGVQYLYDSDTCNGDLNNVGCGPATGQVSISPAAAVSPALMTSGNVEAVPVNQNASAGMVETRTIEFRSGSGTCTAPVNPLAINASAAQPNRPNYVINDSRDASTSTLWNKRFAPALYYVLPTGFGNCDSSQEPFCHLTGGYVAYVPHYTPSTTEVTLNGGSTDQALVDGFILADQYELEGLTGSDRNALIWFDNCGHGDVYEECKGSVSCDYMLGSRKSSLPTPPNDGDTYTYSVTNSGPAAIVFGKECCASWYQKDDNTGFLQPPVQIHDRFGVFVGPNSTFDYQTLFSDKSIVAYDAATGNRLYKLRLNAGDKSAVFGCTDAPCRAEPFSNGCPSVDVTGSDTSFSVELTQSAAGSFVCDAVGECPFGMTASAVAQFTACTQTESSFLLGVPDWAEEHLSDVNAVLLHAWGGKGQAGDDKFRAGADSGAAGLCADDARAERSRQQSVGLCGERARAGGREYV